MNTKPSSMELIRAMLDGKVVQFRPINDAGWPPRWYTYSKKDQDSISILSCLVNDLARNPHAYEFRIKPEALVNWLVVWRSIGDSKVRIGDPFPSKGALLNDIENNDLGDGGCKIIRLEVDPETLQVISATTEEV